MQSRTRTSKHLSTSRRYTCHRRYTRHDAMQSKAYSSEPVTGLNKNYAQPSTAKAQSYWNREPCIIPIPPPKLTSLKQHWNFRDTWERDFLGNHHWHYHRYRRIDSLITRGELLQATIKNWWGKHQKNSLKIEKQKNGRVMDGCAAAIHAGKQQAATRANRMSNRVRGGRKGGCCGWILSLKSPKLQTRETPMKYITYELKSQINKSTRLDRDNSIRAWRSQKRYATTDAPTGMAGHLAGCRDNRREKPQIELDSNKTPTNLEPNLLSKSQGNKGDTKSVDSQIIDEQRNGREGGETQTRKEKP